MEHEDTKNIDPNFYERADAHIELSNRQLVDQTLGKVSSSMMYATARFNSWVSACGFEIGEEMNEKRNEIIEYFVEQYKLMLAENLDDYIQNYESYMKPQPPIE